MVTQHAVVKGMIFDMDGTLTEPAIDFQGMRRALNMMEGDVLTLIGLMPKQERLDAEAIIARFEDDAAQRMVLAPGARQLIEHLTAQGIPHAILTRNVHSTIDLLCEKLGSSFEPRLDRTFTPPKPEPHALLHILECWGMRPQDAIMVGDSSHDLHAAQAAKVPCALLARPYNDALRAEATWYVDSLEELIELTSPDDHA